MLIKQIVPTALNLLALVHWNLHDVQILNSFFAAVPKRLRLDSTLLTQGPTLHHLTSGIFHEAHRSTYFQCNVSKYAHVLGLKLPKISQVRASIWVSSRTSLKSCTGFPISAWAWIPLDVDSEEEEGDFGPPDPHDVGDYEGDSILCYISIYMISYIFL